MHDSTGRTRIGHGAGLTLTIDLGALARNWVRLASIAAPAECAAVVKANAYGLGIECAVPALLGTGCRIFFVALPDEGERVRAAAPNARIYVLGGFFLDAADRYIASELRPVLNHREDLESWSRAGGGRPAALHVDTGMNRLGFPLREAMLLAGSPLLRAAGVELLISHLACADEEDHELNTQQLAQFAGLRSAFPDLPASLANSAGIGLGKDFRFDIVRPGIGLYGGIEIGGSAAEPVVTATARILQVREVDSGETVGYGAAETVTRPTRIATLAAGYADGYLRAAGSSGDRSGASVAIAGFRAPLIGRVSMDLMTADVTDIPAHLLWSAEAELFGSTIPIAEVAAFAGTIPYELLTGLSRRAQRIYVEANGPL